MKKNTNVSIKVTTNVRAGGLPTINHNRRLTVKSAIKAGAGILHVNHNRNPRAGLKLATGIRAAGLPTINHNRRLTVKSAIKAGAGILHVNHNRTFAY